MRILYLFPEEFPLPKARSVQVFETLRGLAAQGDSVLLIASPCSAEGEKALREFGVSCLTVSKLLFGKAFPVLRSTRFFAKRCYKEILKRGVDAGGVVFVRHIKQAYYMLRENIDLPLVYEAHEIFSHSLSGRKEKKIRFMEAFVLQNAKAVVAISDSLRKGLVSEYGVDREISVIHSGAPDYGEPSFSQKKWDRVVYVGSWSSSKGVDLLLRAASRVPDLEVVIAGGSEADREWLLQKSGNSVPDNVTLLGRLSRDEVRDLVMSAGIAILPNREEWISEWTSPLKLFEYMAGGCAIVSADIPPVREVIDKQCAVFFSPGELDSLVAALRVLADDPHRSVEIARNAWRRSRSYSWGARAEKLRRVFEEVHRLRAK